LIKIEKASRAIMTFFFFSNQFREIRVGRELDEHILGYRLKEIMEVDNIRSNSKDIRTV